MNLQATKSSRICVKNGHHVPIPNTAWYITAVFGQFEADFQHVMNIYYFLSAGAGLGLGQAFKPKVIAF